MPLIGPQAKLRSGAFYGEQPSYPTTAAAFLSATGINPASLYTCLDASGSLVDSVGAANLSPATSPAYRQPIAGSIGVSTDSASNTGFQANVNDPGASSYILGAIGIFGTTFAATLPGIWGRNSGTGFPACQMYLAGYNLTYPTFLVRDAVSALVLSDATANVVTPIRPVLYLGQIDRAGTTARFLVADSNKVLVTQTGSIAGFGTLSGGSVPLFSTGFGQGVAGGFKLSLGFTASGAQCEGSTVLLNLAKRLGFAGE
jgi:hypothetical protein